LDDHRHDHGRNRCNATNPHFAFGWVGQELNVSYTLPQIIERSHAALEQRIAIYRWLNTVRASIQEADADGSLQLADCLRHRRLLNSQLRCGFRHAARFNNGKKDVQIPQAQAPPDPILPIDRSGHRRLAIGITHNRAFTLYHPRLSLAMKPATAERCDQTGFPDI
jgi:hypothetical protein